MLLLLLLLLSLFIQDNNFNSEQCTTTSLNDGSDWFDGPLVDNYDVLVAKFLH